MAGGTGEWLKMTLLWDWSSAALSAVGDSDSKSYVVASLKRIFE